MMSDRESTFVACVRNPECDTTRLVHADAVQESGDADLAAIIRVGVLCSCAGNGSVTACLICENKRWLRRCEHEGCREHGRRCVLEGLARDPGPDDPDTEEWLCGEHARERGYCPMCGSYWGGIDSFENSGLCDHCANQVEADYEEEREWEDEQRDDLEDWLTDQQ